MGSAPDPALKQPSYSPTWWHTNVQSVVFHRTQPKVNTIQRCPAPPAASADHGLQAAVAHTAHPRITAYCCRRQKTCGSLPPEARYSHFLSFLFFSLTSVVVEMIMVTKVKYTQLLLLLSAAGMLKQPACMQSVMARRLEVKPSVTTEHWYAALRSYQIPIMKTASRICYKVCFFFPSYFHWCGVSVGTVFD